MSTDTNAAETVAPVAKVEVPKIAIADLATAIVAAVPALAIRKTESKGYVILGTAVDGDANWKRGLFFQVNPYATGNVLELRLYSPKKSAHLAGFKDRFNQFAGAQIGDAVVEQLPCGLATRLRVKLANTLGLEKMVELATQFIALVSAEVEAVRSEIVIEPPKEKKAKKVKAEKTEAPAQAKKAKSKSKVKKVAEVAAPLNPEVAAALADIQA